MTWVHLLALLDHIVRMMYWVWVPGFLLSAWFSLRYQHVALEGLLKIPRGAWRTVAWAALFGMTCSANRRRSLQIASDLRRQGIEPAGVLAFLVSSHNLVLYTLVLLMLLQGGEFAVGQFLGGAVMLVISAVVVRPLLPSSPLSANAVAAPAERWTWQRPYRPSGWGRLLSSGRGWWETLAYIGRECRLAWLNFPLGLVLASLILTTGLEDWWIDFHDVGGGGALTDLLNALIGPAAALLLCVPPVGNLLVGASLFKSYTIAYPGLVSFLLASVLHPCSLRAYTRMYGPRRAGRIAGVLYGSAALSGLIVTGVFALFRFRPGHVPLFRELVDTIMMWMPFAM
jgi:hypothetical protein